MTEREESGIAMGRRGHGGGLGQSLEGPIGYGGGEKVRLAQGGE